MHLDSPLMDTLPSPQQVRERLGAALREAELLRRLQAAGMIERLSPPPDPKPAGWQPLVLTGEPLSETITRMRREVP